ncbi:hypothetical protein OH809_38510 [Streptomyces sp. NBC_00873]|uniref:hypothetical protein n=1 Tax=unclassified Streptomyces TaxID=2593676 RepID=UPI003867D793|nr:hypothetical protein OH809_38510 [Streptomyces sp. NBC_00873]WTA42096.1 hypothetical protein OH821_05200 [Streptomyces sp. NBC_00842]
MSFARLLLLFDRNTPSLTSVPSSRPERELLQTVREFPGTPDKLRLAAGIKRYLDAVPR